MVYEHKVIRLRAADGRFVDLEVNFSKSPKVKDCKIFRFKIGKDSFDLTRDDLTAAHLMFSDVSTMSKFIPQHVTRVHKVKRNLTFDWTASKDYKKGDKITVVAPWIDTVVTEEEVLTGNFAKRKVGNPLRGEASRSTVAFNTVPAKL